MSLEHSNLAAFVAALRSPELGVEADWRDLADVLWLATSSVSPGTEAGSESPGDTDDTGLDDENTELVETEVVDSQLPTPLAQADAAPREPAVEGWRLSDDAAGEGTGLGVDLPPWLAIPGRAEIARALRPLKRRRPSQRRRVLDPEATVDRFCDSGVLVPVVRPARQRWFEVAVVADASQTMSLWHDTVAALADLLERHGAFRGVTRWTLADRPDGTVLVSQSGVEHQARDLADATGQRLILVVTDAVGDLWRREATWSTVHLWGSMGPVALVHMLPDRMWGQTATGEADVAVRTQRAGETNTRLDVRAPWWWDEDGPPKGAIPILALDEASIAPWARLVSGDPGVAVRAVLGVVPDGLPNELAPEGTPPELLGDMVRLSVSSVAYRLAALLSAVDVSLPVARAVMVHLLPEARQMHLAELLAAGVLQATNSGEHAALKFAPGIRSLLQETLTTADVLRTWRAVTPLLTASGRTPQFSLLLTDGAEALGGEPDPMARIAADLAQRLGLVGRMPASETLETSASVLGREPRQAPAPDFSSGRRLAMMIASTKYDHPELISLKSPEADVRALADVLRDPDIGGYTVDSILVNQPVSRITDGLAQFFQVATSDDVLLVYFAGHGLMDTHGELYLAGADTQPDRLFATGLRAARLRREMSECNARGVILILDCSHAGAIDGSAFADVRWQPPRGQPLLSGGQFVLAASGAVEAAFEDGRFPEAIIHGLVTGEADRDGDGLVGLRELFLHVEQRMIQSSRRQTPQLISFGALDDLAVARAPSSHSSNEAPTRVPVQASPRPDLAQLTMADVMTPRAAMSMVGLNTSAAEVIALTERTGQTQLLVIGSDPDDVIGTVRSDTALAVPPDQRDAVTVAALLSPPWSVPETMEPEQLLEQMRKIDQQLAYVVNEYGVTVGTVSRQDLVGPAAEMKRGERALEYYEQALAIRREVGDRAGEATALTNLGDAFDGLGDPQRALELYEQALAIRREVGDRAGEAATLTKLSNQLAEAGRRDQALAPIEEAVTIFRRLAAGNPAAYEPDLAMSLNNLSNRLAEAGRREEALAPIEDAVTIYRRLAAGNAAAYEPDLASSLNNLSNRLAVAGRREEALAPIEDAVTIYRRLAAGNAAAYEPDLASSLNNLSIQLAEAGRREEALAPIEDAVKIRRRLAAGNAAAYEPDLASSLNNLSNRLAEAGRREEALAPIEEAVTIYRRLAAGNAAAYEPDLASSLNNLSNRLAEAGRREEALAPIEDAVKIRRRLAAGNAAAYEPDLASSLNNLSIQLAEAGRREEALAPIEDAVKIRRRLAAGNAAAYEPDLASSLNNLSNRLAEAGRREEALAADAEAEEIARPEAQ